MVDLVSISFVRSLGMSPCDRIKHQHVIPLLEGVGGSHPQTYGFYYLRMTITDRYNRSFDFVRPFLAIDRDPKDSQVLLGRPALKDFKINICNSVDSWEFEFDRQPKIKTITPRQIALEIASKAQVFEVRIMFNPEKKEFEIDREAKVFSLDNVPERIRLKHEKFFDTHKAETPSLRQTTDHAIELKPGTEPPYMRTYNMSPAELKVLEEYINEALTKG